MTETLRPGICKRKSHSRNNGASEKDHVKSKRQHYRFKRYTVEGEIEVKNERSDYITIKCYKDLEKTI